VASKSEIVIRAYAHRGSTHIQYTTKGKYVSFQTAGLSNDLQRQALQPTSSLQAFWESVLALVNADIVAGS
jgi:hypothetical protein